MDKIYHTNVNVKNRPGFALMVTLSVLAVIIALTVVLLSYFKEVRHEADDTTALIQANLFYADITNIFARFENKKTLFTTLYQFPVPLRSPDGKFAMMLRCEPLSEGVNIKWLAMENMAAMQEKYTIAQTVFDTLVQLYNLEDASRLQELIMEETNINREFNKKEYSRLRQKKGIISYRQFESVISRYQMEVDDPSASLVPWQKYFTFSRDAEFIDAEYSSPELIALLFDIDLQTVKEWHSDLQKVSLATFVNNNGGDYNARKNIIAGKKFLEESECTVSFKSAGGQYGFRFEYIKGEAKHFEFYGTK